MNSMDTSSIDHLWDVVLVSKDVSPGLASSLVQEILETMKIEHQEIPDHYKKLFCFKCFNIFKIGENCKVTIGGCKKHPNTKFLEYHCLKCKGCQRINVQRNKETAPPVLFEPPKKKTNENRRKLLTSLFK